MPFTPSSHPERVVGRAIRCQCHCPQWSDKPAQTKMDDTAFVQDLDRVIVRLAQLPRDDEDQLASVLDSLLPKLLLLLASAPSHRRAKIVEVLNHIRQWGAAVRLPVDGLIAVHELGPASFSAPFALLFLEQAVAKSPPSSASFLDKLLNRAAQGSVAQQASVVRILFGVANFGDMIVPWSPWLADVLLDLVTPIPPDSPRAQRLALAPLSSAIRARARTPAEDSERVERALALVSLSTPDAAFVLAFALCAKCALHLAQHVSDAGDELLKQARTDSKPACEALFAVVLGSFADDAALGRRPPGSMRARVHALAELARMRAAAECPELLAKAVVAGALAGDAPKELRKAAARLAQACAASALPAWTRALVGRALLARTAALVDGLCARAVEARVRAVALRDDEAEERAAFYDAARAWRLAAAVAPLLRALDCETAADSARAACLDALTALADADGSREDGERVCAALLGAMEDGGDARACLVCCAWARHVAAARAAWVRVLGACHAHAAVREAAARIDAAPDAQALCDEALPRVSAATAPALLDACSRLPGSPPPALLQLLDRALGWAAPALVPADVGALALVLGCLRRLRVTANRPRWLADLLASPSAQLRRAAGEVAAQVVADAAAFERDVLVPRASPAGNAAEAHGALLASASLFAAEAPSPALFDAAAARLLRGGEEERAAAAAALAAWPRWPADEPARLAVVRAAPGEEPACAAMLGARARSDEAAAVRSAAAARLTALEGGAGVQASVGEQLRALCEGGGDAIDSRAPAAWVAAECLRQGAGSVRERARSATWWVAVAAAVPSGARLDAAAQLCDLLGEAEEDVRACAARALALLYAAAGDGGGGEAVHAAVARRLSVGNASARRGNAEREQPFRELLALAQHTPLVFALLGAAGGLPWPPRCAVRSAMAPRLFIARFDSDAVVARAARAAWTAGGMQAAWDSAAAALALAVELSAESLVDRHRRAAVLALVELSGSAREADAELEALWLAVLRAMDDVDEGVQTAAAALGRAVRRLTLARAHEELLPLLLDRGAAHASAAARRLAAGVLCEMVSRGHVPAAMAARAVAGLEAAAGDSESMALQYAQFHAQGGAGTGALPIDRARLDDARARLALAAPEHAAARGCVAGLRDAAVGAQVVTELARLVSNGVGLATLVCACDLVAFAASDEWPLAAACVGGAAAPRLLRALADKLVRDPSPSLRKRAAAAGAAVARHATEAEADAYAASVGAAYLACADGDEESTRILAAAAAELAQRLGRIPAGAFAAARTLGRHDEDAETAAEWARLAVGGGGEEAEVTCAWALGQPAYRLRRLAGRAMQQAPWGGDALVAAALQVLGGPAFAGKEAVVAGMARCTGRVDDVAAALLREATGGGGGGPSRFYKEAALDALAAVLPRASAREATGAALTAWLGVEPPEPLLWAAALRCLCACAVGSGAAAQAGLRGLGEDAPWNVRAAALGLIAAHVREAGDLARVAAAVRRELAEGRKSAVLVAALACASRQLPGLADDVRRVMAASADPRVVRAAEEALRGGV